jgi:16S rRNA (cytosine1402-N4)-methyltransferase
MSSIKEHPPQQHVPVLLNDVVTILHPQIGESYLDLTAGYGGHAAAILEKTGNDSSSVLVDRDEYALSQLSSFSEKGAQLVHNDFLAAASAFAQEKRRFDMILVDLGVSSPQLDQSERGFSFKNNGPLDMRMDQTQELSAEVLLNTAPEQKLVKLIHEYGEESFKNAKRFAHAIVTHRPLKTTKELADLILENNRGGWSKIHPATRTFQAIRIAVNDELGQIEKLLPLLPELLNKGGRVAIISFHSLEDRLVKQYFKDQFSAGYEATLQDLTKKPIAGNINDVHNPRSRSAKLRGAVKI